MYSNCIINALELHLMSKMTAVGIPILSLPGQASNRNIFFNRKKTGTSCTLSLPIKLLFITVGKIICFHWENCVSIYFHIEWDMIVVTVFLSIFNEIELYLAQNWKEHCHHDHIPFNVKVNGNIVKRNPL